MKIAAICDFDTAIGFQLAGIKEVYIPNGNLKNIWFDLSDRDDIGILLITEKIVEDLGKVLKDYRIRNIFPIIVEIPDKNGRRKEHVDFISHVMKKAVGIEVNR